MPLSRPSGEATSGLRAWCITLIVAASTPRSATLSGSVKSVPYPRSALRVIPTTTPWLKRPSDCSKLNCWTSARSPGVDWRAWSPPSSATLTGSTPVASTIRSAAFHQQSSKQPTTMNTMNAANYNWTEPINRASDKPGEIHKSTCDLPFQFLKCLLVVLGRSQRNLFLWLVVDQEMPQLGQ